MISDYEAPAAEEKLAHISPSPPVPRPPSLHSPSTQDSYIDLEFERGLQQQTQAARRPLKRTRSEDELVGFSKLCSSSHSDHISGNVSVGGAVDPTERNRKG